MGVGRGSCTFPCSVFPASMNERSSNFWRVANGLAFLSTCSKDFQLISNKNYLLWVEQILDFNSTLIWRFAWLILVTASIGLKVRPEWRSVIGEWPNLNVGRFGRYWKARVNWKWHRLNCTRWPELTTAYAVDQQKAPGRKEIWKNLQPMLHILQTLSLAASN